MKSWVSPKEAAEAIRRGRGRGVRIAILDSGVEFSHPRLEYLAFSPAVTITGHPRIRELAQLR